jgi:hypothetical protein
LETDFPLVFAYKMKGADPNLFRGVAGMITVEDCRRRTAQWRTGSQSASDPKTSASMRRLSDAWTTLGEQIEHATARQIQLTAPMRRPSDLASRDYSDTVQAGDVLRGLLRLSDEAADRLSG